MKVHVTTKFKREFRKLPEDIRLKAKQQEKIFRKNPRDHRLKSHKLKGGLKQYWAISVTRSYRIIFEQIEPGLALFLIIGNHDIYQ